MPCYKTIIAEDIARLFISYVYYYYGPLQTIMLDYRL
jgi:hypothetical protein